MAYENPEVRKKSDVALLYCEDPVNDPGGGWKTRSRTIEKSYRPDLPQLANAWMCVSDEDGKGTYKVQQKNLTKISPSCWMLCGENEGIDDHWHSAKITVGQFLVLNDAAPEIEGVTFFDMSPICPPYGSCTSHITDESGSAWAFPNEELWIGTSVSGPFKPADLRYRWSTGTPTAISISSDNSKQDVKFVFKGAGGGYGALSLIVTDPYGGEKGVTLTVLGQNAKSTEAPLT